jgi:hypothetical protein
VIKFFLGRREKLLFFLFLFSIPFFFFSCSKKEVEIIPEEKFVTIYLEVLKAQDSLGTSAMFMKPALEEILKRNGVNRNLYDKTVDFYMKNPEDYKDFMLLMEERIVSLKDSVTNKP